jgi:hypothetical protein
MAFDPAFKTGYKFNEGGELAHENGEPIRGAKNAKKTAKRAPKKTAGKKGAKK